MTEEEAMLWWAMLITGAVMMATFGYTQEPTAMTAGVFLACLAIDRLWKDQE